jgi:hypothetical protein
MNYRFSHAFINRTNNGYRIGIVHDKENRDTDIRDDITNEYVATSWPKVLKILKEYCQDFVKEEVNAD